MLSKKKWDATFSQQNLFFLFFFFSDPQFVIRCIISFYFWYLTVCTYCVLFLLKSIFMGWGYRVEAVNFLYLSRKDYKIVVMLGHTKNTLSYTHNLFNLIYDSFLNYIQWKLWSCLVFISSLQRLTSHF